jgi:SAM-dependent methyltransferase
VVNEACAQWPGLDLFTMRLRLNVSSFIPPSLLPAAKKIYYTLFRWQLRLRCRYEDWRTEETKEGPIPPAMLRFRVSESISMPEFQRIGKGCFHLVKQNLSAFGVDLADTERVLDFGCGCGRTLKWFIREYPKVDFYGADVDDEAIAWCQKHLARGRFSANSPEPPLPFPDRFFDVVYCFSVFTHLNEALQDCWLLELKRILKPAGVLVITVHGQNAAKGLDTEGRAMLTAKGFVHRRSKKLSGLLPEWYQTTWHSRDYIVSRLSASFSDVHYTSVPDGMQDVVIAKSGACFSIER